MLVATHPGSFHADDAFAVATLGLAHGGIEVVRTRDAAEMADADVRVDVGERSDPGTGDFDHHQKGGAGARPNDVRYASFGEPSFCVVLEGGCDIEGRTFGAEMLVVVQALQPEPFKVTAAAGSSCLALGVSF